jgi:hypothetical protein
MITTKTATLWIGSLAILGLAACTRTTTEQSKSTASGSTSTAPSGTAARTEDKALVRFVNATPSSKDLYFGDMTAFSNVPARTATGYMELPANRHDFKLYDAGSAATGNALATNSEGPSAGHHYTIVALNGEDRKAMLDPISDDLAQPDPGKAKLRVIHAAPGVKKVDIYAAGTRDALIDGVGFKDATSYKEVDPTTTEIDVRSTGSKSNATKIGNLSLAAGKLYTLLIMGGNGRPVTSTLIEDQLIPATTTSSLR